MSDDYLWDKSGEPDPEVVKLERELSPLRHEEAWREPKPRTRRVVAWAAGGALALAAAVAIAIGASGAWRESPGKRADLVTTTAAAIGASTTTIAASTAAAAPSTTASALAMSPCVTAGEGFAFAAASAVACGGAPASSGKLPAGVWLETPENVAASVQVADIGDVTLNGGSKLRVVESSPREHRLELVRGSLHAKVSAPPRLFVIDTRAATAVDLGCSYDLSIDGEGRSHLHVLRGAVSLEGKGRVAYVPRGASVTADPERGPGVVIADGARAPLVAAAAKLEGGDDGALAEVLDLAGRGDSATLWNLLAAASKEARPAVVRRLEQLGLRPAGVSRDALLAGRSEALEALRDSLENLW